MPYIPSPGPSWCVTHTPNSCFLIYRMVEISVHLPEVLQRLYQTIYSQLTGISKVNYDFDDTKGLSGSDKIAYIYKHVDHKGRISYKEK